MYYSENHQNTVCNELIKASYLNGYYENCIRAFDDKHKQKVINLAISEEARLLAVSVISPEFLPQVAEDCKQFLGVRRKAVSLMQSSKENDKCFARIILKTCYKELIRDCSIKITDEDIIYSLLCNSDVDEATKFRLAMSLNDNQTYIEDIARSETLSAKVRNLAIASCTSLQVKKHIARTTLDEDVICFILSDYTYGVWEDEFLNEMAKKGIKVAETVRSIRKIYKNRQRKGNKK